MEIDKIDETIDPAQSGQDAQNSEHKDIFEEAKKFFGDKIEGSKNLEHEDIPVPVRDHIERHSHLTAVQPVLLVLTLAPGLIVAPVLGVLGFSSIGSVAGKRASNRSDSLYSQLA